MRGDPDVDEAPPLLRFEDVSVRTPDGANILSDVDLVVPGGEITTIVGSSGAGKTTLLRLCNRLEVPTKGRLTFEGHDLAEIDPRDLRRRVGMVFQRPVLFGGSVRDNLRVAAPQASDEQLAQALDQMRLPPSLLDRPGGELSGGEGQRICLARTLLTRPAVLLMDEPTSAVDPGNSRVIEQLTRDLVAEGVTVLWVTHDLAQARRLGGRLVAVEGGRVMVGDEAEGFLGEAPTPERNDLGARGRDVDD